MLVNKRHGTILLVIGIVILLLSLLADPLHLGQAPRFGTRQLMGVVVGVVAMLVGWTLRRKK